MLEEVVEVVGLVPTLAVDLAAAVTAVVVTPPITRMELMDLVEVEVVLLVIVAPVHPIKVDRAL